MVCLAQIQALSGRAGLPGHIGDFGRRTQVLLWSAVAIQAPAHAERLFLGDHWHLIDAAVTRDTADPALNVSAVVEVHVVR